MTCSFISKSLLRFVSGGGTDDIPQVSHSRYRFQSDLYLSPLPPTYSHQLISMCSHSSFCCKLSTDTAMSSYHIRVIIASTSLSSFIGYFSMSGCFTSGLLDGW